MPPHVLRARRVVALLVVAALLGAVAASVTLLGIDQVSAVRLTRPASLPPAAPTVPPRALPSGPLPEPTVAVVVAPDDTVWGLAAAHLPPGRRLRDYVTQVLQVNGVDASALQPGMVLRLPTR